MQLSVPAGFSPAPLFVPIQVLRSTGIPEIVLMTIAKQVLTTSLWEDRHSSSGEAPEVANAVQLK